MPTNKPCEGILNKKQDIIQAATRLFAEQSFEGTATLQIAREAGVTEPLIYYHFKGKDEIFSYILETSFTEYSSRLETLEREPGTGTKFERIKAMRGLDVIGRRGIYFSVMEELNEASRERKVKKDSRRKAN